MMKKILIAVFMLLLIMPSIVWGISGGEDTTNLENRKLADKPTINNIDDLFDITFNYQNYFEDHTPFKADVVRYTNYINVKLFNVIDSNDIILGKNSWLFYKGAGTDVNTISDYIGLERFSSDELEEVARDCEEVSAKLEEKGIEFSIMVCPNKEHIYYDYLGGEITRVNDVSKAEQLIAYMQENTDVNVIYPIDDLLAYKSRYQVYYKYDTHWNLLGGFIGTRNILQNYGIEEDSIDNYKVIDSSSISGDLAGMLNMEDYFDDDKYFRLDGYKDDITVSEEEPYTEVNVYTSNALDERTIMIVRDSFGEALMEYIPKNFQKVIFIYKGRFKKEYIDEYKPDIVIYESVERLIDSLFSVNMII